MKSLRLSNVFKRDVKRLVRRGHSLTKLGAIVTTLRKGAALSAPYKPHPLKGEWSGYWDCHIENDWVLIYKVTEYEVRLARTRSHADLFE